MEYSRTTQHLFKDNKCKTKKEIALYIDNTVSLSFEAGDSHCRTRFADHYRIARPHQNRHRQEKPSYYPRPGHSTFPTKKRAKTLFLNSDI